MKFIPWFKALNFPQQSFRPPVKAYSPIIYCQNRRHFFVSYFVHLYPILCKIFLDCFNPARLEATGRNNNNPVFFAYFLERFFDSRNRQIRDVGDSLPSTGVGMDDTVEIKDYSRLNGSHPLILSNQLP